MVASVDPGETSRQGWSARLLVSLALSWMMLVQPVSGAEVFLLETAAGKTLRGPLTAWREDGGIELGGADGGSAASGTWITLRREGRPLPPLPRREHLLLANGDRLVGNVVKLVGERLHVRMGDQALEIPLSTAAAVWLTASDGPESEAPHRLLQRLSQEKRTQDIVTLRNGDRIEGILTSLDETTAQIDVGKKPLTIARNRVATIALNTELATIPRPKGAYYRVVLQDGSRLSLLQSSTTGESPLNGMTLHKSPLKVPRDTLSTVFVLGGPAVYLSDLKPQKVESTAFLGSPWPFTVDAAIDGRDLRLGAEPFDKGLSTHSETRLTYDLAGRYRQFTTRVGLDPFAGRRGSVRVRVLVDGKPQPLPDEGALTARTGSRRLDINVTGARTLTLAVEHGEGGGVQARVNWAEPRLIAASP